MFLYLALNLPTGPVATLSWAMFLSFTLYSVWLGTDLKKLSLSTRPLRQLHLIQADDDPGYVYVLKREDGILKIGKAINVESRLRSHEKSYGQRFTVVQVYNVPDMVTFEKLALLMTRRYKHEEGNRRELRKMTQSQLNDFHSFFDNLCYLAEGQ